MPASKKAKTHNFTQTKPKGMESKEKLIQAIRAAIDEYTNIFTFDYESFRTVHMTQLRNDWPDSKFFLGNNKVMQIALGRTAEEAGEKKTHRLAHFLNGHCGLLFTNRPKSEVKKFFNQFGVEEFARSNATATIDFVIPAGPLPTEKFPHSMEPHLRSLGLPTSLQKGIIYVLSETVVCKVGDTLSAEACRLLKLFNLQTVEFKINLTAHYSGGITRKIKQQEVNPHDDYHISMQEDGPEGETVS